MDYKIVLDSGHGGDDIGATANGIVEKDLTLKISNYIFKRLNELGIPVTMTRTTDETVSPTERVTRILNAYGNNPNVIVISNHINAGKGDGAEVIYALRNNNTLANKILKNIEATGQNIRDAYQRRLPSDTSKDYYFIHRDTGKTQPLIIEYGFLDSAQDDVNQLKNNYEAMAEAVVKSLAEYVGKNYVPITNDNTYIVKSGDSLWSISKKYNISVDELKKINNLTSNLLKIGQVLKLSNIDNKNTYIVNKGDTLYSIARKFNTTVNNIKNANNLTNDALSVGQKLIIPTNSLTPSIEDDTTYTVKKGDNLYSIAKNYGISQQELMNYNNLTSNLLKIGQILKIPNTNINTYTVNKGDTLYSIAKKFNTSVQNIKDKNNLKTNTLSIGQVLKI